MTDPRPSRSAAHNVLRAAVAVGAAVALVGTGLAVRDIAQARRLLHRQSARMYLRLLEPGGPAQLAGIPHIRPDSVSVRPGAHPGERTEVWAYGSARVTVRFTRDDPAGVVTRLQGEPWPLAWPRGRQPRSTRGNLSPG